MNADRECYECESKESIIGDVKYWLSAVVEHLYSGETYYMDDLEFCLEELLGAVDMKIPNGNISFPKQLTKIDPPKRDLGKELNWWKILNNNHLKECQH